MIIFFIPGMFFTSHCPFHSGMSGTSSLSGQLHALLPVSSLASLHVFRSPFSFASAFGSGASPPPASRWSPTFMSPLQIPSATSTDLDRKGCGVSSKTYATSFVMIFVVPFFLPFFVWKEPVMLTKKLPSGFSSSPAMLPMLTDTLESLLMSIPSSSACWRPMAVTCVPVSTTLLYSLTGL